MKLWSVEVLDFGNANETYITVAMNEQEAIRKVLLEAGNQNYFVTAREIDVIEGFRIELIKD